MKRMFKLVLILLLVPFNFVAAQQDPIHERIKAQLNSNDKKNIEKANKLYENANSEMKNAENIEASNKKKALKIRVSASKEFENANKIVFKVYKNDLKHFFNNVDAVTAKKAEQKIEKAELLMKEAKKKREASLRLNVYENVYELLEKANSYETQAISNLADVYEIFIGMSQVGGEERISNGDVDTYIANNEKKGVDTEVDVEKESDDEKNDVIEDHKEHEINVENETMSIEPLKIAGTKGVIFLIQVTASKTPVSGENLKKNYKVNLVFEKFDDWYKYFVDKKFSTLDEANAYNDQLSIRGTFIVAFKNGEKVSIAEAQKKEVFDISKEKYQPVYKKEEDGESNNSEASKIVYRLEIGISTKRLDAMQVRQFKNGGKEVVPIDRGGWFSYTIGDFISELEAKTFKRVKGLKDATILKIQNGKVIE